MLNCPLNTCNLSPVIFGGFTLVRSINPLDVVTLPSLNELFVVITHPYIELKTKDARLTSFNNSKDRFDEGIIDSFNYLQIKQSYDTSVSDEIRSKYDYIFKLKVLEFYFGIPISM